MSNEATRNLPARGTGAGAEGGYATLHWLKYFWKPWRNDGLAKMSRASFSWYVHCESRLRIAAQVGTPFTASAKRLFCKLNCDVLFRSFIVSVDCCEYYISISLNLQVIHSHKPGAS